MVVSAAGNDSETVRRKFVSEGFGVFNDLRGVGFKFRLERFAKRNGFSGNDVHQWSALSARENGAVNFFSELFVVPEDKAAARSAK